MLHSKSKCINVWSNQSLTCEPENVKFPPDCSWVDTHVLTDKLRPSFTRITFESIRPTYSIADEDWLVLETMEVKLIESGAKYRGRAIGIGGPLLGCFLRNIWIGVWPKLAIWSSIAALCKSSSVVSRSTAPS